MRRIDTKITRMLGTSLVTILLCFCLAVSPLRANSIPPRLEVGTNLLPAVISADLSIEEKSFADEIIILVVYRFELNLADIAADRLKGNGKIKGRTVTPVTTDIRSLDKLNQKKFGGILIVEKLSNSDINSLIDFAKRRQTILFSPYEGDIKRGVSTGIHVTDRVLPYINPNALQKAGIKLKVFFERIAAKYE